MNNKLKKIKDQKI